jgi:tRNA/tmRNA/rRNA uracil-C5-methylase (TrmA/RlmC/RlmD family)
MDLAAAEPPAPESAVSGPAVSGPAVSGPAVSGPTGDGPAGEEPGEGTRVELTVGVVAHGGHCVARIGGPGGQVVFVRHALPGERVIAEITELHRGYLRADAVTVLRASPDRVTPPCPWARPGACGGCDLQHVAPAAQRAWKAAVVREQLTRLGGLDPAHLDELDVRVTALPGPAAAHAPAAPYDPAVAPELAGAGGELLGWRTRVRYAVDATGRAGLLKHRSHEVVPIDRCRIAHPAIQELPVLDRSWPEADSVAAVASSAGDVSVRADDAAVVGDRVREIAVGRSWTLDPDVFWQVHPAAPDTLARTVLDLLRPTPGETAWDLYGGAGLFAAALAERVGGTGAVTLVESAGRGVRAARANLLDLPQVRVLAATVEAALRRGLVRGPVDLVVLDPPRTGAGAQVVRAVAGSGARAVAYVACDPAALARDVRTFAGYGWRLTALRAYDCFPMTQHVECVALLVPADGPAGGSADEAGGRVG